MAAVSCAATRLAHSVYTSRQSRNHTASATSPQIPVSEVICPTHASPSHPPTSHNHLHSLTHTHVLFPPLQATVRVAAVPCAATPLAHFVYTSRHFRNYTASATSPQHPRERGDATRAYTHPTHPPTHSSTHTHIPTHQYRPPCALRLCRAPRGISTPQGRLLDALHFCEATRAQHRRQSP